jgi:hypothetical protein
MKILIVGGYGTFGARLVRLLADEPALTILVAGRRIAEAQAFCAGVSGRATLVPFAFDRDGDVAAQLATAMPDVLVDASGPFQNYRGDPYRVAKACIAARVHYLDLADATAFVTGIASLDAAAKAAGLVALSGVSTFPVLSHAAVRRLSDGMRVADIAMGIAPSAHAGIGRNVIAAIASYAGKPVRVWREGGAARGTGMMETRRVTIAPPGYVPLRPRRFALVDVPDLVLIPERDPALRSVWAGAGTEPAVWFRGLVALAGLVRLRLLPSLSPLTGLFHWVGNRFVWGEGRGGMFVEARGRTADGEAVTRCWHMIAEGDAGPFVPAMAVHALLTKWLRGDVPASGARACVAELELDDYAPAFGQQGIVTGITERKASDAALPLYRRFFGEAWSLLPDAIRAMHDGGRTWIAEGRATVERGRSVLARIIATAMGFPKAGDDVPVSVRFDAKNGRETWTRTFAGRAFSSVQFEGRGRDAGHLCERFGPLTFGLAMAIEDGRLRLIVRQWSVLGLPLPRVLAPTGNTFESAEDGRFHFHVEIGFPWTGLIVRYRGWLKPFTHS